MEFGKMRPIEFIAVDIGQEYDLGQNKNSIIMVVHGSANILSTIYQNSKIKTKDMFFLPSDCDAKIESAEKCLLICINLTDELNMFFYLCSNKLQSDVAHKNSIEVLTMNDMVFSYALSLQSYRIKNINDNYLWHLKVKELDYLLKISCSQEELQAFLRMDWSNDFLFSEQVHTYLPEVRSVRQLAEKMNYSYSGFNKRFRRVFNMSAYNWVRNHKAKQVYQDICQTNKSLKEISTNYNFATLSHFNEFCHKNLGCSPSEIRRKNRTKQYL
ncbi:AraC family transcriptional regulator [Dysgonomonas sp. 520]|uniref:helix-turn-helix domain-containing protein n=1 Tax=Dysgonomonas sp. 520 TaxID=2302931 RepID=UPI0013D759CF|nr:helix-turn-helix transcriptional regulator [Dysgonomonas sp. 520]